MSERTSERLVGRVIINVRRLTETELKAFLWDSRLSAVALVLDDGSELVVCQDEELNGRGVLLHVRADGGTALLP